MEGRTTSPGILLRQPRSRCAAPNQTEREGERICWPGSNRGRTFRFAPTAARRPTLASRTRAACSLSNWQNKIPLAKNVIWLPNHHLPIAGVYTMLIRMHTFNYQNCNLIIFKCFSFRFSFVCLTSCERAERFWNEAKGTKPNVTWFIVFNPLCYWFTSISAGQTLFTILWQLCIYLRFITFLKNCGQRSWAHQ